MFNFTKTLFIFLILPIFFIVFTNCSSDDSNPVNSNDQALIGTWDLTSIEQIFQGETTQLTPEDVDVTIVIVFESDHSYDITQTVTSTGTEFLDHGSWNLLGDNLVLNPVGNAPSATFSYSTDQNLLILVVNESFEGTLVTLNYCFTKR